MEFDSAAGESEPSAPPKRQSSVSRYRQRSLTTPVSMVGRYHHHRDRYDHEDRREDFITRWKARLGSKRAKQVTLLMYILCTKLYHLDAHFAKLIQALFETTTSGLDSTGNYNVCVYVWGGQYRIMNCLQCVHSHSPQLSQQAVILE